MAYTRHGYHIPGSPAEFPDSSTVVNCGGTRICSDCSEEAREWLNNRRESKQYVSFAGLPDNFLEKAEKVVSLYADKMYSGYMTFDVYVFQVSKVLQNWKALVGTTIDDGRHYEVTYNSDKKETYLNVYTKETGIVIPDEEK